jgi:hypothetical protein
LRTAVDEYAFGGRWLRERGGEESKEKKEEEDEGHGWKFGIRRSCCEKVLWWVLKEWEGRKMGNE